MEKVVVEETAKDVYVRVGGRVYTSYNKSDNVKICIVQLECSLYVRVEEDGIIRSVDVWWKDGSSKTSSTFDSKGEAIKCESIYFN